MKQFLLIPLAWMGFLPVSPSSAIAEKAAPAGQSYSFSAISDKLLNIGTQEESGTAKMRVAVFKAQEFCRLELKDFDFEARFNLISANIYFSGTNFKNVEKGSITSSSLKPVKNMMTRCGPGSIVIFDDVKVIGPDNEVRTIAGLTIMLF